MIARNLDGTFPPGTSGNPAGRPTGSVGLRTRLRRILAAHPKRAEQALLALLSRAEAGDVPALKLLLDSADGLLPMKVEGLSEDDIQERLVRVMTLLRERLPVEFHQTISDVAREAMVGDGENRW